MLVIYYVSDFILGHGHSLLSRIINLRMVKQGRLRIRARINSKLGLGLNDSDIDLYFLLFLGIKSESNLYTLLQPLFLSSQDKAELE